VAVHPSKGRGVSLWVLFLFTLAGVFIWFALKNVGNLNSQQNPPPSPPAIVSRDQWGARSLDLQAREEFGQFDLDTNPEGVLYYQGDLASTLNTIVVHHSAFPSTEPLEVQELHMDVRGFADVGYHYLIDVEGTIFEGRQINIRGAHVQGYNTGSVGIVLLGNFNEDLPSGEQLVHLRLLVDYLRYRYDIRYLAGHRDYPGQSPDGTECPGNNLYPLLSDLARELGMRYGTGGYVKPAWFP
jgi:hypothetical protein